MLTALQEKKLCAKSHVWLGLTFFLACYVYLWLFLQPRLIYDGFGAVVLNVPVFATGWSSLRSALDLPGGLLLYAYGFLSQGFCYSWLGALLIMLMAASLVGLARLHYVRVGRSAATILAWFPALVVFLLYNHYDHPLAVCLSVALGLLSALVCEMASSHRVPVRIGILCAMAGMSYWLGGAGAAYIFALMTAIHLWRRGAWPAALLALPVTAGLIWLLADRVFFLSPRQAFLALTPFCRDWAEGLRPLSRVLIVLLYLFVPATTSLLCLSRFLPHRDRDAGPNHPRRPENRKKRGAPVFRRPFLTCARRLARPAVPLAVLALGWYGTYDAIHRRLVVMNSLTQRGRWPEVLACAEHLPTNVYSIYANHDIDRALYHTGRLGYDMFRYPQNPHALLLTHEEDESCMTQLKMADAFTELGNVDLAEKLAGEFFVAKGPLGVVLVKLAWISIIKGQEDTARVYLHALRKDLIYRGKADAMLSGLEHGLGPQEAAYVRRINSYIRRRDSGRLNQESIEEMLTGLMEQNPHNRMAFEYLMACYLLAGQVDKVAANMKYLEGLGYREIPTLYEEAMAIYYASRRQPLDPDGRAISLGTVSRYERFMELNNSLSGRNRRTVLPQLVDEFGTSYFFYYRFSLAKPTSP